LLRKQKSELFGPSPFDNIEEDLEIRTFKNPSPTPPAKAPARRYLSREPLPTPVDFSIKPYYLENDATPPSAQHASEFLKIPDTA
jgi:hypothetical protein